MTARMAADAATLRWARTQQALTLDPRAQNEGTTTTLAQQMYEPLVMRGHTGAMVPALATGWAPSASNPSARIFTLRKGVTFHDGAAFGAADVLFSHARAVSKQSDVASWFAQMRAVEAPDPYTVDFLTDAPSPIFPDSIANFMIMDRAAAEANGAALPDRETGNYATPNANGAGPFRVTLREPALAKALIAEAGAGGAALGLDRPFVEQHLRFLGGALRDAFGVSYRLGRPVGALIAERAPATLELAPVSGALAIGLGAGLGVHTAIRRGGRLAGAMMTGSLIGKSPPTFPIGILLIWIFSAELG